MALPPRPIAPPQALRSNPDTFSLNAELTVNYQWTAFPAWIEAMGDFVVARAEEASAAVLTGDITPAPERAAHYLRLNSGGTGLEFRSPVETATDLGQYGRNLIINGDFRINQRGYVSGTPTAGTFQFTLDRWFLTSAATAVTFTGNASGRILTVPSGGFAQIIEGANIKGGNYVLNWEGTAVATVNGASRTKGEVFTLPANTNVSVAFVSGTLSSVQLERGSVVTPFEWRSVGQELALCQRYFIAGITRFGGPVVSGTGYETRNFFPVTMRASPTVTLISTTNISFPTTASVESPFPDGFSERRTANATTNGFFLSTYFATAELTS